MANTFTFIGKILPVKETEKFKGYDQKTYDSGWTSRKVNFNVVCGDNRHLVTADAGCWVKSGKIDANQIFKSFTKTVGEVKGTSIDVKFKDRNDPEVIDRIAGFKKYKLETVSRERKTLIAKAVSGFKDGTVDSVTMDELGITNLEDALKLQEAVNTKCKEYIHGWDFVKDVSELVATAGDRLFYISGDIDIQYSEKDGEGIEYLSYKVNKILLADEGTEPMSKVDLDFYFTDGNIDDTDYSKTGRALLSGYVRYYYNNKQKDIKGNFAAPTSIVIDKSLSDKADGFYKLLKSRKFSEDNPVKELRVSCIARDGAIKEVITEDMLTDEQKELIEYGLITFEEIQKETVAYGESKREFVFSELGKKNGKTSFVEDSALTLNDLKPPHSVLDEADGFDDLM